MTASEPRDFGQEFGVPGEYRIVVQGHVGESMSGRLGEMTVTRTGDTGRAPKTILVGQVRDQTELRGIIETLYELHLSIISVERMIVDQEDRE